MILIFLSLSLAGGIGLLYIYQDRRGAETREQEAARGVQSQKLVSDFSDKCYGGKWIDRQDTEGFTAQELTQLLLDTSSRYRARTATLIIDGEANVFSMEKLQEHIYYHCSDDTDIPLGKETELAAKLLQMDKDLPVSEQEKIITGDRKPTELTITVGCQYSQKGLAAAIRTIENKYVIPPKDSRIDAQSVIHREENGKSLDLKAIEQGLKDYLNGTLSDNYSAAYQTTVTDPAWTLEDVEKVDTVISHHSTTFRPGTNEGYNIKLAASRLNGVFLLPGEKISFLKILYNGSDGRQYKKGGALYKGKPVQAIGGGNCQVASTAYLACLKAGIRPKERYPHTKPTAYVPMGLDAALSVGDKDLVIQNTKDKPVWILAATKKEKLLVQVLSYKNTLGGYSYHPKSKKISAHKARSYLDVYRRGRWEKRIPLYTDIYQ